jgi:hypothetical protein
MSPASPPSRSLLPPPFPDIPDVAVVELVELVGLVEVVELVRLVGIGVGAVVIGMFDLLGLFGLVSSL